MNWRATLDFSFSYSEKIKDFVKEKILSENTDFLVTMTSIVFQKKIYNCTGYR